DTEEPTIDVAQQNLGCIRDRAFDLGRAPRAARQRSRASERLLAVGCHDRRPAGSAEDRIAQTPAVLVEQARSATRIAARPPWARLNQHLDTAGRPHAKKSENPKPAKPAHRRNTRAAPAAPGAP